MTFPAGQVCCARCGHWWHENDPEIRYINIGAYLDGDAYDWFCADETSCDDRIAEIQFEQRMAGDHPDGF